MLTDVNGMKRKVLVVDDNEINRCVLKGILEQDYQIIEAANGREALDILLSDHLSISAVLLDIVMPVMDGYAFLKAVRQDERFRLLPIIVTTTQDGDDSEIKALLNGASDFLTKPYKPAIIQHRLLNLINYRENAAFVNSIEKDKLTQIYNKEFFYHRCERILSLSETKSYDIIYANIEKFKLINDLYGPHAGDELLKLMAQAISRHLKPGAFCGRLNADHFGIFMEREDDLDDFFTSIARELKHFQQEIVVRYGIYQIKDQDIMIDVMFDRAKLAIQSIKGKYGKYYAYYNDSIREELLHEQFLTASMQDALKNGEFQVFLQPKYRLSDQSIVGAEALVRWIQPENGIMSPAMFIPLFEKNGFITELDMYVWDVACQYVSSWIKEGIKPVPISVNVSRLDVYHPDLSSILKGLVEKYEIPISYLHLEITESAYTKDNVQVIKVVEELRELGFIVEMDDFGAGYSSLNMLTELPIDVLKLDMRFLNHKEKNREHILLKFVINLAKQLHLKIVAEGVETKRQELLLLELGCDYGQGYVFSKPIIYEDFNTMLKNTRKALEISSDKVISSVVLSEQMDVEELLNEADAPIIICKGDKIVYINRCACRLFHLTWKDQVLHCVGKAETSKIKKLDDGKLMMEIDGVPAVIYKMEALHKNQDKYGIYLFQFL